MELIRHRKVNEVGVQCDVQRVILRQRVPGSVRAVRAVQNTRVFLTETRVVADVLNGRVKVLL